MSLAAGVVLGLLLRWVIEWVTDWIYWRRAREAAAAAPAALAAVAQAPDNTADLEALRAENAWLRSELERYTAEPDDLKVIVGVGPEIEKRLNQAGVCTFAQLAALTPADLARILGDPGHGGEAAAAVGYGRVAVEGGETGGCYRGPNQRANGGPGHGGDGSTRCGDRSTDRRASILSSGSARHHTCPGH